MMWMRRTRRRLVVWHRLCACCSRYPCMHTVQNSLTFRLTSPVWEIAHPLCSVGPSTLVQRICGHNVSGGLGVSIEDY